MYFISVSSQGNISTSCEYFIWINFILFYFMFLYDAALFSIVSFIYYSVQYFIIII